MSTSSALNEALHLSSPSEDIGYLSSLGGDEWDPEVLLGAVTDDIELGPFGAGEGPSKKKKRLNNDPNKARNQRRFMLIQLREEAEKLQAKLQQLQGLRSHNKRVGGHREDVTWTSVCQ
ncbi:unnamed protein product [Phytophthora fragariaefolia]|uniref:Unnamed protein product n=1 Tax=Phytophthora fragariaefolia TaxID=1490495 RepID=A0A9W6TVJ5_9STRA|nr:unnamed protein product [Phytophthora fragariaefolia]